MRLFGGRGLLLWRKAQEEMAAGALSCPAPLNPFLPQKQQAFKLWCNKSWSHVISLFN